MRVLLAIVLATGLVAQSPTPSWREAHLASFDEVWQTVNDTFYDPEFFGLDWAGVRDELRPRVETADSADVARAVIREMLGRLGRSHFGLIASSGSATERGGPATPGFDVRIVNRQVLVTRRHDGATSGRASEVGPDTVLAGDVLVAIDGRPVSELVDAAEGASERDRALAAWHVVDGVLRGPDGSRLALRLRRAGATERDVVVTRRLESGEVVRFGNLPPLRPFVDRREVTSPDGARVGVISFNLWLAAVNEPIASAVDEFREHRALVFDLRGNPGGLAEMIRGIAGHVIDEPVVLGRMRLRSARLEFPVNPRRSTLDGRSVVPFAGPVAILVDELTGSTSECFAGGLQSLGRARIFGRQTMGQALPALTRQLSSGDVLLYGVGDFETSTGQLLEGEGVVPDEVVPLSPAALRMGRDSDLEAALAWLDRLPG